MIKRDTQTSQLNQPSSTFQKKKQLSTLHPVTPNLVSIPVRANKFNRNRYFTHPTFPISDTFTPDDYTVTATTIFNHKKPRTNTVEAILNVA
jgi:hypothetical protein